jgi:UDP-N-acetylglucosamine--N-acetylmuramyl-(pentapeptide) pyrophosphoryl-undecaprenol N-acetylglucosamine transferase
VTLTANVRGIVQATSLARRFRPDVVVATGGYVAFPAVAGARAAALATRRRVPIALLEPNAEPGLTNRLLEPFVDEIWLGVGGVARRKAVLTGTPVRASLRVPLEREVARTQLGLASGRTTIVAIGGSQGARRLNEAMLGLDKAARRNGWQVLALTGAGELERARTAASGLDWLHVAGYLDDPAPAYAAADIVVARAGASTLAELAATGTPALLVPYPHATADHQTRNAEAVAATGAARVIADADLDAARLGRELESALEPGALAALRQAARERAHADPAAAIAARIVRLVERG